MRRYISGGLVIVISIVISIMLISLGNLLVKAEPTQDTTPPIINVTPEFTGYINTHITVSYEVIDDESGVQKIQYYWSTTTTKPSYWYNLSNTSGTLTGNYEGIRYLHIQAWDNEGNYSYKWFGPYQIDLSKPTVSISPSSSKWTKQVTVTITASDLGNSGVKNIQYRISADEGNTWGNWITVTESSTQITLSNNGKYKIEAVAEDNAGNISNTVTRGTYYIDSDSPEISVDNEGGGWASFFHVKVSFTDTGGSGVTDFSYSWSKSKDTSGSWSSPYGSSAPSSGSYIVGNTIEGIWYLHLRIRDAAGNETRRVYGPYNVDRTSPTVSFSPDGVSASSGGIGKFKVKIQASDNYGLKTFQYAISEDGGKTWGSFIDVEGDSEIIELEDPGKYKIKLRAEDLAGNVVENTSNLYNIDGVAPIITVDIEKQEEFFSRGSLIVNVTVRDEQNNLRYVAFSTTTSAAPPSSWNSNYPSSQSYTFSVAESSSGTYYLHVIAEDIMRNTTYRCFGPYNIGTNNVRIWAEPGIAEWTFSDINVTIKAAHYNNEIDYIAYRIYNSYTDSYSDWQYVYSDTAEIEFTGDDLYKIEAYAVSKSGLKSSTQEFGPYFKKLPRANYSLRQGTKYESKLYAGLWDDYYTKTVIDKIRKNLEYDDYRKFTNTIITYRLNYNKRSDSNSPYYELFSLQSPWVRSSGVDLNIIRYHPNHIYVPEFFLKPVGPLLYTAYGYSGGGSRSLVNALNNITQEMFTNAENVYLAANLADSINASIRGDGPILINDDSTAVEPYILEVLSSGKYKNAMVMGGTGRFDGLFGIRDMPVNFIRVGGIDRGTTYNYVRNLSENIFNPPALLREPGKRYAVYSLDSYIGNNMRNYLENDDLSGALYYVAKNTAYGASYYAFEGNPFLMFCYDNVYFYGYFRNYRGELIYQYISDKRFKDQEQMLPPEVDVDIKTYRGSEFIEVTPIYIDNSGTGLKYRKYAWTNSTNKPTDSQYIEYEGGTISPPSKGTWYLWLKTEDNTIVRIISDGIFEGQKAEEMFGPYEIAEDNIPPSITADPPSRDWDNTDVVVTPIFSDTGGSGIKYQQYAWRMSTAKPTSWNNYTGGIITQSAEGVWYLHLQAEDNAGNYNYVYFGPYKIDKTPPSAPIIAVNPSSWTNGIVTVTITPGIDSLSGVARTEYRENGGSWTTYSSSFTISTEGTHTIEARTIDKAGNSSTISSNQVFIDRTAPIVTANPAYRDWGNTDVTVTLTYSDSGGSGLSVRQYAWSTSTAIPATWNNYSDPITQSSEGIWYLHVKAVDSAGNTYTTYFGPYKIDKTAPTIAANTTSRDWTNTDVTVTLTYNDTGGSGLKLMQYKWSDSVLTPSEWDNYMSPVTQTESGIWYLHAKAVDNAGNVHTVRFGPYMIDKVPPTVVIEHIEAISSSSIAIVVDAEDPQPGIGLHSKPYRYYRDDNLIMDWTSYDSYIDNNLNPNTLYSYTVQARDALGNTSQPSEQVFKYTLANIPTNLTARFDEGIVVQWNPNGNPEYTKYEIEYTDGTTTNSVIVIGTSVVIEDVQIDKLYRVRARAINEEGIPTNYTSYIDVATYNVRGFKITKVRDIRWNNYFEYPITEDRLPVINEDGLTIGLGYGIDFEVETEGFGDIGDKVIIDISFTDMSGNELDLYLINGNGDRKSLESVDSENGTKYTSIILTERDRREVESSDIDGVYKWTGYYFLPFRVVAGDGELPDQIMVVFNIRAEKGTGEVVEFNKVSRVFSYVTYRTAYDDIFLDRFR